MPGILPTLKAFRELGSAAILSLLRYRLARQTGWYRLRIRVPAPPFPENVRPLAFTLPRRTVTAGDPRQADRAARLLNGQVELFGALQVPLAFTAPTPLRYWTHHEAGTAGGQDIKFLWEPARFCWAADLVMAFSHSADGRFPAFFSGKLDEFLRANPPYLGPNWSSGQEVALRLMHLALAYGSFAPEWPDFGKTLVLHAARIPATLAYARAQNNNHLLSEAAGLVTAGAMLRETPDAARWLELGWQTFEKAVLDQFSAEGAYMQQSSNYHRLALQLALWVCAVGKEIEREFRPDVLSRLGAGTEHLLASCDPQTGRVPNLGPNDGAYIFPLTVQPFEDFRPVLQAASRAFRDCSAFEPGPWDDMSAWLVPDSPARAAPVPVAEQRPRSLQHPELETRAFLRAATFTHRPGHADQLHVDIFRHGRYIARDPGTYLYNADPPWDNPLSAARYHNTITIDGLDQMTRAGRFLYVDRAQARRLGSSPGRLTAEHDGYRRLGLTHRRSLAAQQDGWLVQDEVYGNSTACHRIRLHWLLPDGEWRLDGTTLFMDVPESPFTLTVLLPPDLPGSINLARAGVDLHGAAALPADGWYSPTYGVREPAVSFSVEVETPVPIKIESRWAFSKAT